MAYFPPTNSVVAFQSDPTKLLTHSSVSGVVTLAPTSVATLQGTNPWNVAGSVAAFLAGSTNASVITVGTAAANQSVSGTVNVGNFPTTQNISGSVFATGSITALQGSNPWKVELTSGSVVTTGGNSSVQVVGQVPTTSVVVVPGTGVLGSVATLQGTNPWFVQLTSGSVITTGGNSSVQVVGQMPAQSVSGVRTLYI